MKPILALFFIIITGCWRSEFSKRDTDTDAKSNSVVSEIIVYHDECTDCQDIVVDSGEVFVPEKIKQNFRGKELMGGYTSKLNTRDMRLENDSIFRKLFGSPGNWQFENRYRVKGEVIGLKDSSELIFRIYRYEKL